MTNPRDTADLAAEQEDAGKLDVTPCEVVDPDDPSWVDPWTPATPVEPTDDGSEPGSEQAEG